MRSVSWPGPSLRCAMGMIQLVEKSLPVPRRLGIAHAGQEGGTDGDCVVCCCVSARKAVPCSINCHPPRSSMSICMGVEGGSCVVPEEVCWSCASMKLFGGAMDMVPDICVGAFATGFDCMPGMSGMDCEKAGRAVRRAKLTTRRCNGMGIP